MALPANYTSQLQVIMSIRSLPLCNLSGMNSCGYSAETIQAAQNALFPDSELSLAEVQYLLASGASTGIYRQTGCVGVTVPPGCTTGDPETMPITNQLYIINASMVGSNPRNSAFLAPAPFSCPSMCDQLNGAKNNNLQAVATVSYGGTIPAGISGGGGYNTISEGACGSCGGTIATGIA